MSSYYSIIQYIPNIIADERINIGIVVFDKSSIKTEFLSNWSRVKAFSNNKDTYFLDNFEKDITNLCIRNIFRSDTLPPYERLKDLSRSWLNTVQITEPRGSLLEIENLLRECKRDYLIEPL